MTLPSSLIDGRSCGNLADVAVDESAQQPTGPAGRGRLLADLTALPGWMRPLARQAAGAELPSWVLHATDPIPGDARRGAVLMLLADGALGPDLLLTARSAQLRSHAGQPAFPGGALEPGEGSVAAALREANEETGLDPGSVVPAAVLPQLYLPVSHFLVAPVLAHWQRPGPVRAVDPAETSQVTRVPLADLASPDNRGTVVIPARGAQLRTPAFAVGGMVVWGFTAGLVDLLLEWGGWSEPWDRGRLLTLPGGIPGERRADPAAGRRGPPVAATVAASHTGTE